MFRCMTAHKRLITPPIGEVATSVSRWLKILCASTPQKNCRYLPKYCATSSDCDRVKAFLRPPLHRQSDRCRSGAPRDGPAPSRISVPRLRRVMRMLEDLVMLPLETFGPREWRYSTPTGSFEGDARLDIPAQWSPPRFLDVGSNLPSLQSSEVASPILESDTP